MFERGHAELNPMPSGKGLAFIASSDHWTENCDPCSSRALERLLNLSCRNGRNCVVLAAAPCLWVRFAWLVAMSIGGTCNRVRRRHNHLHIVVDRHGKELERQLWVEHEAQVLRLGLSCMLKIVLSGSLPGSGSHNATHSKASKPLRYIPCNQFSMEWLMHCSFQVLLACLVRPRETERRV